MYASIHFGGMETKYMEHQTQYLNTDIYLIH